MSRGLLLAALCSAGCAAADTWYVDGSCALDGDGRGQGCATSSGSAGAWRDPQSCLSAALAGDTCLIKNGTYVTSHDTSDNSENGGFHIDHSGTASAPIVIRNFPGHSPLLSNCPLAQTGYCPRPTITALQQRWVTIEGLRVRGGIWILGSSPVVGQGTPGIVLRGNELTQGWADSGDGNWSPIFLAYMQAARVEGNFIHDVAVQSGGGQQSSGSCIKLYFNTESMIERNTCRHVDIPESQAGGIDDKDQAVRNVHQFNWIEDVNTCVRVNSAYRSTGVRIRGNVCVGQQRGYAPRPAIRPLYDIDDVEISNNTLVGFGQGVMTEAGPITQARFFNNVVADVGVTNFEIYSWSSAVTDYNAYSPGGGAWVFPGGPFATFAAYQVGSGLDAHSAARDCGFLGPTDYHLVASSPCRTAGRAGGSSSGTPLEQGAYGITSCVGHDCTGAGPIDAGVLVDAGVPVEAGVPVDAGAPDAGPSFTPDAGTGLADAGAHPGGGADKPPCGGCSSAAGAPLLLLAAALARHRARRKIAKQFTPGALGL